jgi:23S rRNA (guanosine2251-2'-O)-methyltransferase
VNTITENHIYGRNAVAEAIKANRNIDFISVSTRSGSMHKIIELAKENNIIIKTTTDEKLTKMCETTAHQGVVASVAAFEYAEFESFFDKQNLVILDGLQDPQNFGAIIRSAEVFGFDGIIIPKRGSVSLNSTVFKTSAGAAGIVPVAKVSNLVWAITELKKHNFWIYGADMTGDNLRNTEFSGKVVLVIGAEGFGLSRLVKENCDCLISVPMFGQINSLNASVAAGVCMYEIRR